jgi:hypothetical protein
MYLYLLEEASNDIWYYLVWLGLLSFIIYFLRKDISNAIDPIVFCLVTFSSVTSFVFYLFSHGNIRTEYLSEYLICASMFLLGFCFESRKQSSVTSNHKLIDYGRNENISVDSILDLRQLKTICNSIVILVLITLFLAFISNALAIFSDSPVLDRVAINAANRWFMFVFFACNPIGMALSIMIFINVKKISEKLTYLLVIIIFLVSLASSGSKSAILPAIIALGSITTYLKSQKCKTPKIINKILWSFVFLSVSYFIYITSLPGTGDSNPLIKLLTRVAGSGDNYIYFFVEDQYKKLEFTYNLITYVAHTFTAPFGVKLIPYNIGTAMYGYSTGDYSGFGPNPGYVIEGIIFFGTYLAPLYAVGIGYLTNYTRKIFANKRGNLNLILFIIFSYNAPTLSIDITLYLFSVLSSILITMPIYYFSKLLIDKKDTVVKS